MIIRHRHKNALRPFVGYWNPNECEISVATHLTTAERAFVVAHEYYHSQDYTSSSRRFWWWRELKASAMPLWGFVRLSFRTITDLDRIKRYVGRKGK